MGAQVPKIDKARILKGVIAKAGELKSEEDVKNKVVVPFLEALGWDKSDISFPLPKVVTIGNREASIIPDVLVSINSQPVMVVETKHANIMLSREHLAQSNSYALLYTQPPTIFAVTTNGRDWHVNNIYSNTPYGLDGVLTKQEAIALKQPAPASITPNQINHAKKVLITISYKEEFMDVLSKCAKVLSQAEGLLSEQAFDEMSKVLACKLNEEKRSIENVGDNRFSASILKPMGALKGINQVFLDTKKSFKDVFQPQDRINLRFDSTVLKLVELLEPFDLYGTGEDIKGAVYESFLSETLRGELGQYFTPREIVEFMVDLIDPKIDEKVIDPSCGSGGFLITTFVKTLGNIGKMPVQQSTKKELEERLINECLWGIDVNPRLVKLCKLNLMIHGDGYNHIYCADALRPLPNINGTKFDVVISNPPFNLPVTDSQVLQRFKTGRGKDTQGSDVLFLEKCIEICRAGGRIAIVLPWGILNLPTYTHVRKHILETCKILGVFSLPEGAFIPFGQSHAKTCILYLQKKKSEDDRQGKVYSGIAHNIGYDPRRKRYKKTEINDLPELLQQYNAFQNTEKNGK